MRWRGRRQSSNIQDIRGQSGGGLGRGGSFRLPGGFGRGGGINLPGGYGRGGPMFRRAGGGGISIALIIIALILFFVFGINPMVLLGGF